jgi:EAL domain-containing protein (putative c-di-GMP-specific phosphodiesterase class I)
MHEKFDRALGKIVALGVKIVVDDFGTGYSNLGYLHKNSISSLKIDKSFVGNILQSPQDFAIVATIITMAKSLNMAVVAEGIETADVLNNIKAMGCSHGQGFYWSKPINNSDFLELLKKENTV